MCIWVLDVTRHETRFDTWEAPPWFTTLVSIYFLVTCVARKATVAPLVYIVKQLYLPHIRHIHCNRFEVFTDGSATADESMTASYIPKLSVVHRYKLSHRTSSKSAELSGVCYALRHLRHYQSTNWVLLTNSKSTLLSLCTSESKTANLIVTQAVISMNNYLYHHSYTITYQWIPSHVGIHGNEVSGKRATAARGSSCLLIIPLRRTDFKFIIMDIGRSLNRRL